MELESLLAKAKEKYPNQPARAEAKAKMVLLDMPPDSPDFNEKEFWNELEKMMKQSMIHR